MVPSEYRQAARDFDTFLRAVVEISTLATPNQAYTMTQGVLQAFRRRLDLGDAIRFAQILPPLLRALYVADWDPAEPRRPFADRRTMTAEVQTLRRHHNFSPPTAIADVAAALSAHIDVAALDRLLSTLPPGAAAFWETPSSLHPPLSPEPGSG